MAVKPSLVAFVLARLDDDVDLVLMNTPLFDLPDDISPAFADRFLDRGALAQRVRDEQALVAACVDAMKAEQDEELIAGGGPVTSLGVSLVKRIAARYADHADYDHDWDLE